MNNAMNIERDTRPVAITLLTASADDLDGNAVSLRASRRSNGFRVLKGYEVTWNAKRAGFGWKRGWRATFKSEAEAIAFAESKIETLDGWFQRQVSA